MSGLLQFEAAPGTYHFTVQAEDDHGLWSQPQPWTLVVSTVATSEIDGQAAIGADLDVQGYDPIFLAGRSDVTIPPLNVPDLEFPLVRNTEGDTADFHVEGFPPSVPAAAGETFAFQASGGVDYAQAGPNGADGAASALPAAGPGYAETGTGWATVAGGYAGTHREVPAGAGAAGATWTTAGLPVGTYRVRATWQAAPGQAPDAAYEIYDGDTLLMSVPVDQTAGPEPDVTLPRPAAARGDGAGDNQGFQTLATDVAISSGTLRVVLVSAADGAVDADAVEVAQPLGDGVPAAHMLPVGGISGYEGPAGALVGVFLGAGIPAGSPPATLDFTPGGLGTAFERLAPALGQVFYIGDGLTGLGAGDAQQFVAPPDATRLFVGTADAFSFVGTPGAYNDNIGSYQVRVRATVQALAGWTVFLDEDGTGRPDAANPSTTTDGAGRYAFTGLGAGTYTVTEVAPPGWEAILPAGGTYTGATAITVGAGERVGGVDFANLPQDVPSVGGPAFTNSAPTAAAVGQPYRYDATVSDPYHDALTFDLPVHPAGLAVDPSTGVVVWTPTPAEAGSQTAILRVRDQHGGLALQRIVVQVDPAKAYAPPVITSVPSIQPQVGVAYEYDVLAQDPNGLALTYSLDPSEPPPAGMAFDTTRKNALVWRTPTTTDPVSVIVDVSDGYFTTQQPVTLTPMEALANQPPVFDSSPRTSIALGLTYVYPVRAHDPDGEPITYSLGAGAPAGAALDPKTGLLTWTPTSLAPGNFTVNVTDDRGLSAGPPQTFTVLVTTALVNGAPVIDSQPRRAAVDGREYVYDATATDPDHDSLAWSLDQAPAGMAINPATGAIRWTPGADVVGVFSVTVRVHDPYGGSDVQPYTITVRGTDTPPVIHSTPSITWGTGAAYTYAVQATDADGDPLKYTLTGTYPADMAFSTTNRNVLEWPDPAVGVYPLEILVSDGAGGVTPQDWTLTVSGPAPDQPPTFTSTPQMMVAVGQPYPFPVNPVTATDPDGDTVTFTLAAGAPSWLTLDDAVFSGTPTADDTGTSWVTVLASDGRGGTAEQDFPLTVVADAVTLPSIPDDTVTAGASYFNDAAQATDTANVPLTYALTCTPPAGVAADTPGPDIDPDTGYITWAPGAALAHTVWLVTVTATDALRESASTSYRIHVDADTTPPVVLVHVSADQVNVGQTVTVTVEASDDVAVASLGLTENGASVTLDARGEATVTLGVTGTATFVGSATDTSDNPGTSEPAIVTVIDPSVTDTPAGAITALAATRSASNGYDVTTHLPSFAPVTVPAGQTITSTIAVHDPAVLQSLAVLLSLRDDDDSGLTATLTGPNGQTVPLFSALAGANLTNTTFDDGAAAPITSGAAPYTGTYRPAQPLAGLTVGQPAATGTYTLTITNNSTTQAATLTGWSLTYRKAPTAEVTAPVQIVGTAKDDLGLAWWTLTASPAGSPDTTVLGSGTSPVVNGVLGAFDPTMLPDGPYVLELTVANTGGHTTVVDQTLTVTGSLKLGNLHLSFTDLTIPVAGIPITITRTYDTLNAGTRGDFGYGWTLDEGNVNLQVSQPDGTGPTSPYQDGTRVTLTLPGGAPETFTFIAQPIVTGYFGLPYFDPTFVADPGVTDKLTVQDDPLTANGDGTYSGLDADMTAYTPADSTFGGTFTVTTRQGRTFVIDAATGALLSESDRNGNTLSFSPGGITSSGGRSVVFERDPDTGVITSITDPRGNSIVYTYDPNTGDLVSVTDRAGSTTTFKYDPSTPHFLQTVTDASHKVVAQVAYTAGRVSGITDALGNTTVLSIDGAGSLNASVAAPGASPMGVVYDEQGNVTGTVDAAGNTTSATYSGTELTSQTQTVGGVAATTSYTYYPTGDVETETDALGHAVTFTYNGFGQPLTSTDALGNTTVFGYDGYGNVTSTASPGGVTTTMVYDASGNVTGTTTPDGTTGSKYDAFGAVLTTTDAHGTTTTNTYDADGNQLTSQWTWFGTDGYSQQVMTTTNVYDANDRLIQTTAADNTITDSVYDANGRVVWADEAHLAGAAADGTQTVYDDAGRVVRTEQYHNVVITVDDSDPNQASSTFASSDATAFSVSDTAYDAQGRVQWTDDARLPGQPCDGTLTIYDADGNPKCTQRYANVVISAGTFESHGDPLSSSTTTYDAAGNVATSTSASGAVTIYQYDAAGQQIGTTTTADGATTTTSTTYDAAGRVASTTDALNHTTRFVYDGDGNLVETIYPDGTSSSTRYDTSGHKVASIDADGNETDYQYDSYGQLSAVLLPGVPQPVSGQTTPPKYVYTHDAYGNLTSETDPLNDTTNFSYDAFGRKTSETLPMGQTESWTYNDLGQLDTCTDFDGNRIVYSRYDSQGRVLEKDEYAPGDASPRVTVTYGYDIPDAGNDGGHSDTVTVGTATTASYYDVHGNLVEIDSPQGAVNYSYYADTGLKQSVSTANTHIVYGYDGLGRLSTVTVDKLDGTALLTPLVTTYTYYADNSLDTTTQPNGTVETRTYDVDGRLASIETVKVAATDTEVFGAVYTRDPAGNIITDTEKTSTGDRSE